MAPTLPDRPTPPDSGEVAGVPRVQWDDVWPEFIGRWEQGQHVAMLGKTDSGKTTLALELLRLRVEERQAAAVALGTKPRDTTLKKTGWPIIRDWPPTYAQRKQGHIIYWPNYSRPSTAKATTKPRVVELLDEIMLEGGWCLFVDEMAYLVETLGLRWVLDEYWNAARSSGISLIAGTQRPVWLARSAVSQVNWAVCFRINDLEDRTRAAEILGDRNRYREVIGQLRPHEFVLVHTVSDTAVVTILPKEVAAHPGR